MIIKQAELAEVAGVTTKSFPKTGKPEIAFAGKSNVGKSSLINTLLNRKSLARTSATPGKTQTVNFYRINQGELYFVDLPGYGYAKVSLDFKAKWGPMVERYLRGSKTLLSVFLLIDSRRTPSEEDQLMYEWIQKAGLEPVIIVTKSDKLKKNELIRSLDNIHKTLDPDRDIKMIPFSALKKTGREDVMEYIDSLIQDS